MASRKQQKSTPAQKPNLVSHAAHCSVCAHPECDEIGAQYISWKSAAKIASDYKLGNRSAVYRHAIALGLDSKRALNIRGALERIIEQAENVTATSAAIIQAIALYARINSRGQLISPEGQASIHDMFAKMTREELEIYAKNGNLPTWCRHVADKVDTGGNEND